MRFFNFIALIFITLNVSCNKSSLKKIDLIDYTMDIPNDWSILNIEAIDSESIVLLTKKKDTILCLYGDYKNQFDETNKVFSNDQINEIKQLDLDSGHLFSSETPEVDQAQGTFLEHYYSYLTIDNQLAKIKIPKFNLKKEMGIFFRKRNIALFGLNLDENEQKQLLDSFKSIKFKKTVNTNL